MLTAIKKAMNERGITLARSTPFIGVHVVALVAPFFLPFRWSDVFVCLAIYYARMFVVTAGYHRYFSHRTFKTSRPFQFVLGFLAETSAQKGVLWWAAHHRNHHRYSDTPQDIHSPVHGGQTSLGRILWAHAGWILSQKYCATEIATVPDLAKYPELRWLNRFYLVPPVLLAVTLLAIGGWNLLVWGFFVNTVLLWHGSFTINSLAHVFGRRRYKTDDNSRNNWWLAIITTGEGWHSNHHRYMTSVRQGFRWWQIDFTYYALKVLSWVGLVWDLKLPPRDVVFEKA